MLTTTVVYYYADEGLLCRRMSYICDSCNKVFTFLKVFINSSGAYSANQDEKGTQFDPSSVTFNIKQLPPAGRQSSQITGDNIYYVY